jgi:hypothetical protein
LIHHPSLSGLEGTEELERIEKERELKYYFSPFWGTN